MQHKSLFQHALILAARQDLAIVDRRALRVCGIRTIRIVTSGIAVARELADNKPNGADVIFCASDAEDMSTEHFVQLIRLHPRLVGFPIVVSVSKHEHDILEKSRGYGYSGLLLRPYTQAALQDQLQHALRCRTATEKATASLNTADTAAFDTELERLNGLAHPAEQTPETVFAEGLQALRAKRWTEAIPLLQSVLRRRPQHIDAMLGLSIALSATGHTDKSRSMQRNALSLLIASANNNTDALHRAVKIATRFPLSEGQTSPLLEEAARVLPTASSETLCQLFKEGLHHTPNTFPKELLQRSCANARNPEESLQRLAQALNAAGYPEYAKEVGAWKTKVTQAAQQRAWDKQQNITLYAESPPEATASSTENTPFALTLPNNTSEISGVASSTKASALAQNDVLTGSAQIIAPFEALDDVSSAEHSPAKMSSSVTPAVALALPSTTQSTTPSVKPLEEPHNIFSTSFPRLNEALAVIKVTLGLFRQMK